MTINAGKAADVTVGHTNFTTTAELTTLKDFSFDMSAALADVTVFSASGVSSKAKLPTLLDCSISFTCFSDDGTGGDSGQDMLWDAYYNQTAIQVRLRPDGTANTQIDIHDCYVESADTSVSVDGVAEASFSLTFSADGSTNIDLAWTP